MLTVLATSFESYVRSGAWRSRAACLGEYTNGFYPSSSAVSAYDDVKPFCRTCPEKVACDQYAFMTNEQYGMWAGRTERGRKKARKKWVKAFVAVGAVPPVIVMRKGFSGIRAAVEPETMSNRFRAEVALHLLQGFALEPVVAMDGEVNPSLVVAQLYEIDPIPEVIQVIDRLFTDGLLEAQGVGEYIKLTQLGQNFLVNNGVKVAPKKRATAVAPPRRATKPSNAPPANQAGTRRGQSSTPSSMEGRIMSDVLDFLSKQPEGRFEDPSGALYESLATELRRSKGGVSQAVGKLRRDGLVDTDGARGSGTFAVWLTSKGYKQIEQEPPESSSGSPPAAATSTEKPKKSPPAAEAPAEVTTLPDVDLTDLSEHISKRMTSLLNPGVLGVEALVTWMNALAAQLHAEYGEVVTQVVERLQARIDEHLQAADDRVAEAEARAEAAEEAAAAAQEDAAKTRRQLQALLKLEEAGSTPEN